MSVTVDMSTMVDMLGPMEEFEGEDEDCGQVCVCRVPKSLSSNKPEAFMPQFVGLGPYHNDRSELTMTHELKLATARRILFKHRLSFQTYLISDIHRFYHLEQKQTLVFYKDTLIRHRLAQDSVFLLALLEWSSVHAESQQHSYFLTGKRGLPFVNDVGVELTMDAIIRDVFMLENQIPALVLQQVNQLCDDAIQPQYLSAKMLSFCEKHCPLVNSEILHRNPDHLLDLMYQLIVRDKSQGQSGTSIQWPQVLLSQP